MSLTLQAILYVTYITESKLSHVELSAWYFNHCSSYTVYRRDRENGSGGGVAILVRKDVLSVEFSFNKQGNTEATMCEVDVGRNKNNSLVCMYRPPNSTEECNGNLRQALLLTSRQALNCGDFNFKDWENHHVQGGVHSEPAKLYETCQKGFLHQHLTDFT